MSDITIVLEYIRLMSRYMELLNCMGVSWTPELGEEFARVKDKVKKMRVQVDMLHKKYSVNG